MKTKLNILLIMISAFIGYFVECVSSEKILFIESLLSEKCSKLILEHSLHIIVGALIINVALFLLVQWRISSREELKIYENICAKVFEETIESNPGFEDSDWRVSLLKGCRRNPEKPFLKVVGRYQTKNPRKKSRVKFYSGEGCAGIAYSMNQLTLHEIEEFDPAEPNGVKNYISESKNKLGLPTKTVKKLREKCSGYLCIPIPFFHERLAWGVLSIDCTKKDLISSVDARALESLVAHFSTFFRKKDK